MAVIPRANTVERGPARTRANTVRRGRRRAMTEIFDDKPLVPSLDCTEPPLGSDRRAFLTRSAMAVAIATLTGAPLVSCDQKPAAAPPAPKPTASLDPALDVAAKAKGPVLTTLEEFYKVGPGPSSSHT